MSYVTIIVADGSVAVGNQEAGRKFYSGLAISSAGIPSDVWALQWNGSTGHIEYKSNINNLDINTLPDWATACVALWEAEASKPIVVTLRDIQGRAAGLLEMSDWSALPDVNLLNKSEWFAYRQKLRAIRSNPTLSAVFPPAPMKVWG
jgi:hypothetical protein